MVYERYRKLLQYFENNLMLSLFQRTIQIASSAFERLDSMIQQGQQRPSVYYKLVDECLETIRNILRFPYMLTLREFQSESYLSRLDEICAIMLPDQFQDNFNLSHPFFEYILLILGNPEKWPSETLCKILRILAYIPALRKSSMKVPALQQISALYSLRLIKRMSLLARRVMEEKTSRGLRTTFSNSELRETLRGALLDSINRVVSIYVLGSVIENLSPEWQGWHPNQLPSEFQNQASPHGSLGAGFVFSVMIKENIVSGLSAAWKLIWFEQRAEGANIQEYCKDNSTLVVETWRQINSITGTIMMHTSNNIVLSKYMSGLVFMKNFVAEFLSTEESVSHFFDYSQALAEVITQTQISSGSDGVQLSDFALKKSCNEVQDLCYSFLSLINQSEPAVLAAEVIPKLKNIAIFATTKLRSGTITAGLATYFSNGLFLCSIYLTHLIKVFREKDPHTSGFADFYEGFGDYATTGCLPSVGVEPAISESGRPVSAFLVETIPDTPPGEPAGPVAVALEHTECERRLAELMVAVLGDKAGVFSTDVHHALRNSGESRLCVLEIGWMLVWGQVSRSLESLWEPTDEAQRSRLTLFTGWGSVAIDDVVRKGVQECLGIMCRPGQSQVGIILAGACLQNLAMVVKSKIIREFWRKSDFFTKLLEEIRSYLASQTQSILDLPEEVIRVRSEFYAILSILILNDRQEEFLRDSKSISQMMFELGGQIDLQVTVASFYI